MMTGRVEYGYFIDKKDANTFTDGLSKLAVEEKFEDPYNHTLYVNNSEYEVPFSISIRARRYGSVGLSDGSVLDSESKWFLENKEMVSVDSKFRDKKRVVTTLRSVRERFKNPKSFGFYATLPLAPVAGVSYRRRHFVFENAFRVTVDQELEYFLVDDNLKLKKLGSDDKLRVELKVGEGGVRRDEVTAVSKMLIGIGAVRVLSKRDTAYNLAAKRIERLYKPQRKETNTEIEAKLAVPIASQQVLHRIKRDAYNGFFDGFRVPPSYEFTLQKGKLINYVIEPDKEEYIRFGGDERSGGVTTKDHAEILTDQFGLRCIIKRGEINTKYDPSLLKRPFKTIHKQRKFFCLENVDNSNTYCVEIDRSTNMYKRLMQLEVESVLSSPTKNEQAVATRDIATIAKMILSRYPSLKPTTVSKLDWLKSIRTPPPNPTLIFNPALSNKIFV